jgi:hypothetical protein
VIGDGPGFRVHDEGFAGLGHAQRAADQLQAVGQHGDAKMGGFVNDLVAAVFQRGVQHHEVNALGFVLGLELLKFGGGFLGGVVTE